MARKIHIVGNWKMHQTLADIKNFFVEMQNSRIDFPCEKWIAPQALHIPIVKDLAFTLGNISVGAQNCSHAESGALTGEISPLSLQDLGVHFTLVGHSERRAIFNEQHAVLNQKVRQALACGLKVIFCVGESLTENDAGQTHEVLKAQLQQGLENIPDKQKESILIAYEPVWAIGTGKTATPELAAETHQFIRHFLGQKLHFNAEETIILYGGSVKPNNIDGLLSVVDIDGALVGGASLKGGDFRQLCEATMRHDR